MKLYNPFCAHVIKFTDGTYGVRKWALGQWFRFGWIFMDLKSPGFWWPSGDPFLPDCKTHDRDIAFSYVGTAERLGG